MRARNCVSDCANTSGLSERGIQRSSCLLGHLRGCGIAARHQEVTTDPVKVGIESCNGSFPLLRSSGQFAAKLAYPFASHGRGFDDSNSAEPIRSQELAKMIGTGSPGGSVKTIDLVEGNEGDCAVAGKPFQVLMMQCRVGILLWVDHPAEHIGHSGEPFHFLTVRCHNGVVVGEIYQHEAAKGGVIEAVLTVDVQPAEQLLGSWSKGDGLSD
jgi:hypothetical protein